MSVEWRRLGRGELDHEWLWLGVALAAVGMLVLWESVAGWPPVTCPFRVATGWPCLTCGSTRAVRALLAGEASAAWRWNPLATLALLAAGLYVTYAAVVAVADLPRLRVRLSASAARWLRVGVVGLAVATWVFLVVDGR